MPSEEIKLLLKYCHKNKRGLDYVSQFDYEAIDVGEKNILGIRQILYVHSQFLSLHNRQIIQMCVNGKNVVGESHYY